MLARALAHDLREVHWDGQVFLTLGDIAEVPGAFIDVRQGAVRH